MAIIFLNIVPFKYTKASDTINELLLDSCHNRELMDYFFKHQNNNITNCDSLVLTFEDCKTIERSIPCYFRFLSIMSGLESPYNFNRQMSHYTIISKELNNNIENLNIIDWYAKNQDSITCNKFNEYYLLESELKRGPMYYGNDFDEFLRINDEFYDSIEYKLNRFIELNSPK